MSLFSKLFGKRKRRKKEAYADSEYLDAIEIIKESGDTYLGLLAEAKEDGRAVDVERLEAKLNNTFESYNKGWNGSVKIVHTIVSTCVVTPNNPRLKVS